MSRRMSCRWARFVCWMLFWAEGSWTGAKRSKRRRRRRKRSMSRRRGFGGCLVAGEALAGWEASGSWTVAAWVAVEAPACAGVDCALTRRTC